MKAEPLKGKGMKIETGSIAITEPHVKLEDVKLAVEWLKKDIYFLCPLMRTKLIISINKAFKDVTE